MRLLTLGDGADQRQHPLAQPAGRHARAHAFHGGGDLVHAPGTPERHFALGEMRRHRAVAHRAVVVEAEERRDPVHESTPLGWCCHGARYCANPTGDYGLGPDNVVVRPHDPPTEMVSLEDYRRFAGRRVTRMPGRKSGGDDGSGTDRDRVTRLLVGTIDGQKLRFPLFKDKLSIGRTAHNDIQIKAQYISRRHAMVVTENDQTRIVDWGSKNGVYVNGIRVTEKALRNGDLVATFPISSGNGERYFAAGKWRTANTPTGSYEVYRHSSGWYESTLGLGLMLSPWFFNGGIALHGSSEVPPGPAFFSTTTNGNPACCSRIAASRPDMPHPMMTTRGVMRRLYGAARFRVKSLLLR